MPKNPEFKLSDEMGKNEYKQIILKIREQIKKNKTGKIWIQIATKELANEVYLGIDIDKDLYLNYAKFKCKDKFEEVKLVGKLNYGKKMKVGRKTWSHELMVINKYFQKEVATGSKQVIMNPEDVIHAWHYFAVMISEAVRFDVVLNEIIIKNSDLECTDDINDLNVSIFFLVKNWAKIRKELNIGSFFVTKKDVKLWLLRN